MRGGDDLHDALTAIVATFEQLGIEYLVGGSVASAAHGEFRATNDVDLLAAIERDHVRPLVDALRDTYYLSEDAIVDAVTRRASFNLIHLDTMLKVDVFVSQGRPYDVESLRRRMSQTLQAATGSTEVHLASPEDVVLAKLVWFRAGGESSERQWRDVLGVVRVQAERLDDAYLGRWAEELGVRDLVARALAEARARDDSA